jgi:hypothetical protein
MAFRQLTTSHEVCHATKNLPPPPSLGGIHLYIHSDAKTFLISVPHVRKQVNFNRSRTGTCDEEVCWSQALRTRQSSPSLRFAYRNEVQKVRQPTLFFRSLTRDADADTGGL